MNSSKAVISGIIQGITEFLPVSSSGHLSLFQHFTHTYGYDSAVFTVILHMGTLSAVIIAFWPIISRLIKAAKALINKKDLRHIKISRSEDDSKLLMLLLISLAPMFLSLLLRRFFEYTAGDSDIIVEGIGFLITSYLLYNISTVRYGNKTVKSMTVKDALLIGLMQAVSPLPGISRSGSTIAAAMMLGFGKEFSLEFSFLMGIPTVLAAVVLDLPKIFSQSFSISFSALFLGLAASLISGIASIVLLKKLVIKNKLIYFAYYTFALGVLVVFTGILEHISKIDFGRLLYEIFLAIK